MIRQKSFSGSVGTYGSAALLALASWAGWAQSPVAPSGAVTPPASATPSAAPNPVTMAVLQKGALRCGSRVQDVTTYLGRPSGAYLMFSPAAVDQQLFSLSLAIKPTANQEAYVSANFAPGQANGCGATFESVMYWPQNCKAVASDQFAALKDEAQLSEHITILNGGPSMKIFLMRAGPGCVSIKKEIVF